MGGASYPFLDPFPPPQLKSLLNLPASRQPPTLFPHQLKCVTFPLPPHPPHLCDSSLLQLAWHLLPLFPLCLHTPFPLPVQQLPPAANNASPHTPSHSPSYSPAGQLLRRAALKKPVEAEAPALAHLSLHRCKPTRLGLNTSAGKWEPTERGSELAGPQLQSKDWPTSCQAKARTRWLVRQLVVIWRSKEAWLLSCQARRSQGRGSR